MGERQIEQQDGWGVGEVDQRQDDEENDELPAALRVLQTSASLAQQPQQPGGHCHLISAAVDAIELNHRDARRKLASSAKARDGREDLDERL